MECKQPTTQPGRIHAIDFIKGLCMLLVIIDHAQLVDPASHHLYQMLDQIEVAGFFFISGYLYRDTGNNREWLTNKFQRLMIPFLFFGGLYAFADILCNPVRFSQEWKPYLFYVYLSPVNYPLWFIRALFWIMLIQRTLQNRPVWIQYGLVGIVIGLLAITGNAPLSTATSNKIMAWLFQSNMLSALASYPFFRLGLLSARHNIMTRQIPAKIRWSIFTVCLVLWCLSAKPDVHLHIPSAGSWLFLYVSALTGSMALLLLSKDFPALPLINYIGQHSMTVLGTHAILINIIRHFGIQSPAIVTICTIAAMPPVIYLLQHFLPEVTGEKRLQPRH